MEEYNRVRSHQGRWCYGKTPMQTFLDTLPVARQILSRRDQRRTPKPCGSAVTDDQATVDQYTYSTMV